MKVGIIRFPGSNCDRDVFHVLELVGAKPDYVWWNTRDLSDYEAIVIPGGFSYGDYLRAGAIAAITPIIDGIKDCVSEGKPVLGICNGAQILAEVGLVPGVFTENENAKFICEWTDLKVESVKTPFTRLYKKNEIIKMPIAHAEGRYYTENIQELRDNDQIVLSFESENPNGSMEAVEAVTSPDGRIFGKMAHSERIGRCVATNIPGEKDQRLFAAGINYFR